MQRQSKEPFWSRYVLAFAASALALGLELWLNSFFPVRMTPFLPGFAAVIASAAWAGFGPGVFSTILVTAWCAVIIHAENRLSIGGELFRCALFFAEGLLLSFSSGQLHRARRKAARGEEWHRKLVETAAEGIWVTDGDGVLTYANPRIAEILGLRSENLVGRNMDEFFFPADLSVEHIRFRNLRAGMKDQFDRRLRRSDGAEVWLLVCSTPFHDPEQGFPGVLSMMTDITERKNAEYALRRSEEKFRGLFENVLEGVYQSTPEGRILAANPMLLRMLGMSSESELNDVNIARDLYVDTTVRTRLLDILEREGSFQSVEYELRRRDRQIITVQENARVVRDETGAVLYYEGTLSDIGERKRVESQLRQAQKMEALGRLAAGVAHDFTNILTVISGYAQLVREQIPATHPAYVSAGHVVSAAESAAGLTRQLLSFSHRHNETAVVSELNEVLRNSEEPILELLGERAMGAAVELQITTFPGPLRVQADPEHIRQILIDLSVNVRDAIRGSAVLQVSTESTRVHNDSNPGIYGVIRVTAPVGPTSQDYRKAELADGLGISTTQAIISQYGGFMVMDRSLAGGVSFSVFLPLLDDVAVNLQNPGQALPPDTGGETILLVDDEPLVLEISRDMLERHGYQVLAAPGPGEAERMGLQGRTVDLLITDIMMPQISGAELARRIRQQNPGLKVLFISGYSDQPIEMSGLAATDNCLQKPFSPDALGRKIRQLLDNA